jgi:uroporphyrinogen-III synthase
MQVLVTRPAEDAERTAEALRAAGHEPLMAPLFSLRRLSAVIEGAADAVFATSANALRFADRVILSGLRGKPLFAVGDATADAARQAGFVDVRPAGGDGESLAGLIRQHMPAGSALLQLAGRPRRDEALLLLRDSYKLTTLETYETIAAQHLSDPVITAFGTGTLDAALHFSPRATAVFLDLAAEAGLAEQAADLMHVCISQAAADSRLKAPRIAAAPSLDAMLEALSRG